MSVAVKPAPSVEQPQTDAEYKAAVRTMFARMDELDAHIERNQAEIDRLKAETRVMLASLVGANGQSE